MSILCIDNSETIRKIVKDCVLDLNYEFFEAKSGELGLEVAQNMNHLDLVIIDWNMPGLGGKATLEHFRHKYPSCLIMAMIKFERKDEVMQAVDLGANDYMLKPFRVNDLQDKIKEMIENAA